MSTTHTSKYSVYGPPRYQGTHRFRRFPKVRPVYVGLGALLAVATACGVPATPDAEPGPAVTTTAAKAAGIGEGQHEVGTDIKAGTYTTTVPADELNCYWARVKSFDGELTSIIANGNLAAGAKGRMVVKASDAGVIFQGGCRWVKAAAK